MDLQEMMIKGLMKDNGVVQTPEFRVSYPFVFTPRKPKKAGVDPKFCLNMLFPKTADLSFLFKLAWDVAVEKFGPDKTKHPKFKLPFRDQGEKVNEKGYEPGCYFIIPTSKVQPGIVDHMAHRIINQSEFYSGCYAIATVRAFWYEAEQKGIGFGLINLQKTRDGEPLGSRVDPEKDFVPLGPAVSQEAGVPNDLKAIFG